MCISKEMRAETRHCNFVAGHSVYALETIANMVQLNGEPVCALQTKILLFGKTASIFGERGNLSVVSYDFCTWKYYLKTALSHFSHPTTRMRHRKRMWTVEFQKLFSKGL